MASKTTSETITAAVGDVSAETPLKLPDRYADKSYELFAKVQVENPSPEEARRIYKKLVWRILPFLCVGYHLMYLDKQTVRCEAQLPCCAVLTPA